MKRYDFFVSHSSSDAERVNEIVTGLEKKGAKCWIASRDIEGGMPYSKAIVNGIKESRVFLLCLSRLSAVSDQVLNEIEIAYKRIGGEDRIILQPLFIEDFDIDEEEYDALTYYIKRFNYIIPTDTEAISDIINGVVENNGQIFNSALADAPIKKQKAQYFIDDYEKERLHKQAAISLRFDKDIYEQVVGRYDSPLILDLGSGDGTALLMRLEDISDWHVVGIDHDEAMVRLANDAHKSEKTEYYVQDIEAPDFIEKVKQILSRIGCEGFDIINIVLVLKHLKKPGRVLYKLRRLLNDNGTLIVRDYDDGIQYVFPDEAGRFARLFSIFKYDEYAGESYMGREAYHLLFEAGYSSITLERMGCPTIGYSIDEKEIEYESSFSYLKHDLELLVEKYPDNSTIRSDYEWYVSNEEEIVESFLKPGTVYVAGRMIYTAKK